MKGYKIYIIFPIQVLVTPAIIAEMVPTLLHHLVATPVMLASALPAITAHKVSVINGEIRLSFKHVPFRLLLSVEILLQA